MTTGNHEILNRMLGYHVGIYFENAYLSEELKNLAQNIIEMHKVNVPLFIFEPSSYADVMSTIDMRFKFTGIMLIDDNPCYFLDTDKNIIRVKKSLKISEMGEVMTKIICGDYYIESQSDKTLILNAKEIEFIELIRLDLNPTQISQRLRVNIKTVYAARHRLALKLSCISFQELYLLCKSKAFSDWLLEKQLINKVRFRAKIFSSSH